MTLHLRTLALTTPLLLAALAAGCAENTVAASVVDSGPRHEDPGDPRSDVIRKAVAVLNPTAGHDVRGTVTFTAAQGGGLRLEADVEGLPANGGHGYHVHVFGDCSAADGTSAGTHFNFEGSSMDPPADIDRITGNLGTLQADSQGRATHTAKLEDATLEGPYSIIGRAVIIHAKPNDPAQPPMGGAGARLACGVIGVADG